jgi:hypothetical protein
MSYAEGCQNQARWGEFAISTEPLARKGSALLKATKSKQWWDHMQAKEVLC